MVLYVLSHRNKTDIYFMNKHGNPLVTCLTIGKNNQKLLAYQHNWNWFCNKVGMEDNTLRTHTRNSRLTTRGKSCYWIWFYYKGYRYYKARNGKVHGPDHTVPNVICCRNLSAKSEKQEITKQFMIAALRPGSVKSFISVAMDRKQSAFQHKVSGLEPTRQEQHDE